MFNFGQFQLGSIFIFVQFSTLFNEVGLVSQQATATTAAEGSTYAQAQRFVLHRLNELTGLMNSQGSGYAQAQRFVLHRLNELAGLMQGLRGPHRGRCLGHLRG